MSRLKPVEKYPEEYYKLCKQAHDIGVCMTFPTEARAKSFRHEMYQFRTALRRALLKDVDNEDLQIGVLFANGLGFSVKGKTLFIARKVSTHIKTIREQL